MVYLIILGSILMVAGFFAVILAVRHAPHGYQDELGFHADASPELPSARRFPDDRGTSSKRNQTARMEDDSRVAPKSVPRFARKHLPLAR
jgi:hypothetical protein